MFSANDNYRYADSSDAGDIVDILHVALEQFFELIHSIDNRGCSWS